MNKMIKGALCSLLVIAASLHSIAQTTIKMRKHGNVYILPCRVNGLLLDMIFDTGADDVSISESDAASMIQNGYLKESDIQGTERYRTASGEIAEGTKVIIRKITFAGLELTNIEATVIPNQDAPVLLGQSAIRKLGKIQIDPDNNTLTVFKGKGNYDYSKSEPVEKKYTGRSNRTNGSHGESGDPHAAAMGYGHTNTEDRQDYRPDNRSEYRSDDRSDYRSTGNDTRTNTKADVHEVMKLPIDREGGANAAGVVWHPGQKKYYAAQAGNAEFPMLVFDANGKKLSGEAQETLFDIRGFWYNPNTKTMQANGYNDLGMAEFRLDAKGMPVSVKQMANAPYKPTIQSAGVYDPKANMIYFFDRTTGRIERHNMGERLAASFLRLHLGARTKEEMDDDNENTKEKYNEYSFVYTGIPGSELGLLNATDRQIELYSLSSGFMKKTMKLPDDAPVESMLNFSYSNGIYWLNDRTERVWHGYKPN